MVLDHHYVPPRRREYLDAFGAKVRGLEDLTEDAPFVTLLRILLQQLLGWPAYMVTNITAGSGSLSAPLSRYWLGNSHFAPWGSLFRAAEAPLVIMSDVGLSCTACILYRFGQQRGSLMALRLYFIPWLWLNSWLIAITYLHHTHPQLPKFEPEAWTFIKGATATMDRHLGLIGRYFFHDIIDYHVIHHLFS